MRFDNGWLQWQLDGDPDWQSLVNMDNYETISNKSTSSSVATDTGSETKYTSVAAVEALISDAIDDIDVSDKQDKASAVSAGNVALWASDGKGKYQTAGEVGIATTLDKDDAAYNGAKLVPSNLVADMAVPPLDPTCIDASNNFNQCVLSQDMNGPGGTLQWVWLRMAE
jgi:hypothetical protein